MAEAINFKPDIRSPIGSDYGYQLNNGTFIGLLSEIKCDHLKIQKYSRIIG